MVRLSQVLVALALACGASAFAPARNAMPRASPRFMADSPATGTGPGLDYNPDQYSDEANAGNFRKLSQALEDGDIERKKAEQEALERENAMENARLERERKINFMKEMPDSTPAGRVADFMYKGGVTEILEQLDHDLIGLLPVKKRVREIAALLVLDKMRRKLGFDTAVPSLHMCFTGAPGTGKTTVAIRMGQILQRMGYCRQGHVIVATRDDLVGQYIGHTAPKTKEVIKKAFGGVLLIDEAYYLYNAANDRDYGQESIEILLNVMEQQKDDLIVVLAGYKDRMDKFFSYIPGMASRIGNHIDFPNYEVDELVDIASVMVRDLEYEMDDESKAKFREYINKRMSMPFFSNARTVRNAMDRARMNSAIRIFNEGIGGTPVTVGDLKKIKSQDFQIILDEIIAAGDDAIVA
uniref:AAA+ ATPase domain-containing protein n=1 Tax=Rhizochromulina marina TaxID=1034831 RepID=A0A7S2SBU4_9STRA|mmetsp:Transcript_27929/g.81764  ORF Transcript_27929/g.81764 Transcript_27929/m.81764 type:complete len:411 (+) Transcript_27929:39-1271(+)